MKATQIFLFLMLMVIKGKSSKFYEDNNYSFLQTAVTDAISDAYLTCKDLI